MNAEQSQIPPTSKSKGLVKNILLIFFAITSLLFFVFGFIQKLEADKQRVVSVKAQIEAENNFKEAERQRQEAIHQKEMAIIAQKEADQQRLLAQQTMADCRKNKK